jgi:hypothetical protein
MVQLDPMVGREAGYAWTRAHGAYARAPATPLDVRFPAVAVHMRRAF